MKIDFVSLEKFRGVTECRIPLNGKSTVFFGVNGAGKSSTLAAINLLYSNIINRVVSNRFKQGIQMELSDISFGAHGCKVSAEFSLDRDNATIEYYRAMDRKTRRRTHNKPALDSIYNYFNEKVDTKSGIPIFANYGVNRLVHDIPLRIRNRHEFDQKSAFEKAIESKLDFRMFFEWFRNQEDYENQIIAHEDRKYKDISLSSVRNAAIGMFENFDNLRITRNPLSMKVDKDGMSLSVNQLSDGEKCTFALIGDLARRLALANPESKKPLHGEGVVLIDEIDLHMHPQWQRRIFPYLISAFPNIQFIITTHSPQVLGEIQGDINLFSLKRKDDKLSVESLPSLSGWDTNYILEDFMDTGSVNVTTKKLISEIYENIQAKKYDDARGKIDTLKALTDPAHEDVVRSEALLRRLKSKR